jgi:hypothetical protein
MRLLYCHCAYAKVVPPEVKTGVLEQLSASGTPFDAVADLCEMSARRDPSLPQLAGGPVTIVACYPRAVRALFHAAGAPLPPEGVRVLNMRVESADTVAAAALDEGPAPGKDA